MRILKTILLFPIRLVLLPVRLLLFVAIGVRGNTDIIDQAGRRRDARTDGSAWSGINEMKRN